MVAVRIAGFGAVAGDCMVGRCHGPCCSFKGAESLKHPYCKHAGEAVTCAGRVDRIGLTAGQMPGTVTCIQHATAVAKLHAGYGHPFVAQRSCGFCGLFGRANLHLQKLFRFAGVGGRAYRCSNMLASTRSGNEGSSTTWMWRS